MQTPQLKAETLIEALPYMQKYYSKTVVIKYGGHAMSNEQLKYSFAQDVVMLKQVGINPVIVHGGGPQIGEMLEQLGIENRFEQGMRVTSPETMDIVEMILSGKINKEIVGLISRTGGRAVGFSGRDGHLLSAKKMQSDGSSDLGQVGVVSAVDISLIKAVADFIPVIAPVGIGSDGEAYNINADLAAGSIAAALKAEKLLMLTDVAGLLDKNGERISSVTLTDVEKMRKENVITGGMLPKLKGVFDALKSGVAKAHIIDGRLMHSVLLELFTVEGIGTEILNA
ncbi:MAG: acetylglutamate kinase [Deferribacteraceae bacterium]|nr:acetylglutamate kinase [Deferribacteraceae bacterium]